MPNFTKEIFLNAHRSYQLQAKDIDRLITHYANKGIKIIKNGQKSQKLIEEKRKKRLIEVAPLIEKLQDHQKKYATYFQLNFLPPGRTKQDRLCISNISPPFWRQYHDITNTIKSWLRPNGQLKNLSNQDMIELNMLCEQRYKSLLDEQIDYNIQSLRDVCLEKFEVKQEVDEIRKTLNEEETVGYIFTNNKAKTSDHIECLILTKEKIIKPITWTYFTGSGVSASAQLLESDFPDTPLYLPDLSYFIKKNDPIKKLPHPQADHTSCGTLCLSFLKKLLKNKATELESLTLNFAFYDQHGKKKYFFLPSPSLLLYSQSSKYIDFLQKIMEKTEQTDYRESKDQQAKSILTLQGLLSNSIQQAIALNDNDMVKQNIALQRRLPSFRLEWLAASQQATEKRKKLDDPNSGSTKNLYLMYRTKKLENISTFFPHCLHAKPKPITVECKELPAMEYQLKYK